MTDRKLTARQQRVLRAMSRSWELAADIARRAEVDNRGVGGVLNGLESRGLIHARFDDRYGANLWRLR